MCQPLKFSWPFAIISPYPNQRSSNRKRFCTFWASSKKKKTLAYKQTPVSTFIWEYFLYAVGCQQFLNNAQSIHPGGSQNLHDMSHLAVSVHRAILAVAICILVYEVWLWNEIFNDAEIIIRLSKLSPIQCPRIKYCHLVFNTCYKFCANISSPIENVFIQIRKTKTAIII